MPDPYPAVELRLAQAITTRCLGHWWTAALRFVTGIGHRQTDEIVEAREYRWSSAGWATGPIIGVKISPISGAGPRVVPAFEKSARQPTLQAWRLAPRVAGPWGSVAPPTGVRSSAKRCLSGRCACPQSG